MTGVSVFMIVAIFLLMDALIVFIAMPALLRSA